MTGKVLPTKESTVFVSGFSMVDLLISCWSNRRLSEKWCHWLDTPSVLDGETGCDRDDLRWIRLINSSLAGNLYKARVAGWS